MKNPDTWTRRDAWLGLLFLFTGALLSVFAFLSFHNDLPHLVWLSASVLGPVLVLLGVNAIVRALSSGR